MRQLIPARGRKIIAVVALVLASLAGATAVTACGPSSGHSKSSSTPGY